MSNKLYSEESIQAIANSIRAKNGTSETYTISEMSTAISALPTNLTTKTITANGTYNASSDDADGYSSVTVAVEGYAKKSIENTPTPIATFNASELPMPSLSVGIEAVQSGTGDPSPTNVRPFRGWSAVNVVKCGKNLFDKTATDTNKGFIQGKWINQTGNTFSYSDWNVSEYIRVDGEKIAVSGMSVAEQISAGRGGYCCYDKYKNVLGGGIYNALTQIITLPTNTEYIRISVWNLNKDVCQLELGTTATTYEPYNGTTYTTTLKDGQGNPLVCYGGTLDVVSGELVVTHIIIKVNTLNWYYLQNTFYSGSAGISADGSTDINSDFVCSFAKSVNKEWNQLSNNECVLRKNLYSQGYYSLCVKNTEYTNATDFKNSLDSTSEITFPIATPQTIQLTPTAVKSLLGTNNIWADSGDVLSGEYFVEL